MVYSLLATCKARGIDERAWLEDVLRRMLTLHALQASPAWVSVEGDFDMGCRLFTGSGREDGECRAI